MHRPERTCVGCRGRSEKSQLLRLVWDVAADQVALDPTQTAPGRGGYLHCTPKCLELAIRRRTVGRALRIARVNGEQLERLLTPVTSASVSPAG